MEWYHGIVIGLFVATIFHLWSMHSYKRILVRKAKDCSAEYIDGKFYYLMEEKEYNKYNYLKDAGY